ncbi:MAG TPA: PP2C family protein-serine/threonine phosphatase [Bryobacteraceae bacterium]|jgi:sigma-B regulation protein RsbU (phosphoserine phosphatase)|nr:PP2C family protein-serine/threonine phosphatase [Bryobacteraceae bacterium]
MKTSYSAPAIHTGLVPAVRAQIPGLDYYGECRPARETAWEFFEFLPMHRTSLVCSLGRITGQSVSAAFTMASLQAFLRSLTRHHRGSFAGVVRDLNRLVYEISPDSFHASLFYAWIDPVRGQLQYVSAGHGPVLLIRPGERRVRRLEHTGTVLGLSLRVEFRRRAIDLHPGDLLLAMTDGVADFVREDDICDYLCRRPGARPVDIVSHVIDSARGAEDRTALAVRLQARGEARLFESGAIEELECPAA